MQSFDTFDSPISLNDIHSCTWLPSPCRVTTVGRCDNVAMILISFITDFCSCRFLLGYGILLTDTGTPLCVPCCSKPKGACVISCHCTCTTAQSRPQVDHHRLLGCIYIMAFHKVSENAMHNHEASLSVTAGVSKPWQI